ncbi:uncharacterized protein LOC115881811 isoform X2 [Sitophilus oryzae]|uniref:Uncharacterized protein LOC115881811 isoform X2 n=1 Tax=Sitophilus oryzae TaxID=7048 RepID=A0A6J2XXH7_SITOR|nr:uncharacterized protein LOC115881811 isoform X2 [Sitophilus oryzae]
MEPKVNNDPMWHNFGNDSVAFTAYKSRSKFAVTLEGLQPLIDETYNNLRFISKNFNRCVPLSAYSYYIWSIAYARIGAIKRYQGQENQALHAPPLPIGDYLRSIGNIKDTTGIDYEVDFPAWPNEHGHFGRVSAENHYMYESLAAPVVIAQRMQQDLAYTRNPQQPSNWNLPEDLVPLEGVSAGLPTVNCLGWAPATSLTLEQQRFLESAGVCRDSIHPTLVKLPLNSRLLLDVYTFIRCTEAAICEFEHHSQRGSMAQMLWQKRSDEGTVSFSRTHHYCGNPMSAQCFTLIDRRIATAALITAFRVEKDEIQGTRPYCAYDFGEYKNVPDAWHQTRNRIFNHGDTEMWNLSTHRSMSSTFTSLARSIWVRKRLNENSMN